MTGSRTGLLSMFMAIIMGLSTKKIYIIANIMMLPVIGYFAVLFTRWSEILGGKIPYSLNHRLIEWENNLNLSQMDFIDFIFGRGLGYTGLYIDGMYIKIFADLGVMGIIAFAFYYYKVLNNRALIMLMLVNCITLDVFTNSKIMFFFFFASIFLKIHNDTEKNNLIYKMKPIL